MDLFFCSEKGTMLHENLVRKRYYFGLKWYLAFGNTALGQVNTYFQYIHSPFGTRKNQEINEKFSVYS